MYLPECVCVCACVCVRVCVCLLPGQDDDTKRHAGMIEGWLLETRRVFTLDDMPAEMPANKRVALAVTPTTSGYKWTSSDPQPSLATKHTIRAHMLVPMYVFLCPGARRCLGPGGQEVFKRAAQD